MSYMSSIIDLSNSTAYNFDRTIFNFLNEGSLIAFLSQIITQVLRIRVSRSIQYLITAELANRNIKFFSKTSERRL